MRLGVLCVWLALPACGFEAQHYFWQCPGCQNWDSYPPQRLEDL